MHKQVRVKICGLTREEDVDLAVELGADFCGFIVYPKSPRGLSLERAAELAQRVPEGRRVLVDVETGTDELGKRRDLGFDFYQIHARLEVGLATLAGWSGLVGKERLWIAPKLSSTDLFPSAVLEFANTVLLDTYRKDRMGGTGETGDWSRFADLKLMHPNTNWIMAGGLSPENVTAAIATTGTDYLDVSSRLEAEPGIKDPEKIRALFEALKFAQ
jgi:phosphoribosylanthranilate isomerase